MNDVKVIFENENFLVIEKPINFVVNRSETTKDSTLQDWIEEKVLLNLENDEDSSSDFYDRSGLVHRIDKDTSGILLIAKTEEYFDYLQGIFKTREVEKRYIVMTMGNIEDDRFEVDAPIGRNPNNRFKYAIIRDAKEAQTYFEKIKTVKINDFDFTLLYAFPRTGRTHQIRVHLGANGTPVAGDKIYLSEKELEFCKSCKIDRLMLHSLSIKFRGMNDEEFFFQTEIPKEFLMYLN